MSARDAILAAIRAAAVPPSPAAPALRAHVESVDLVDQFLRVLADVGGRGVVRPGSQPIDDAVEGIRQSLGVAPSDLLVVHGRFAVAENAAVFVDAADIESRADIVRAEHVVLIVPAGALVPTMHEAVRLMPANSACGWFLSGPSKTADIEQSLVIGAQGARTLHVLFDAD